jgi:hypothetical protein
MTFAELTQLVERLRSAGFRDVAGTRIAARIPVAEPLLNELIAALLPAGGAIRQLTLHPQPHDRLALRVKLARPEVLPPIAATLAIERQPELPYKPALALRLGGLPGLMVLAGPSLLGSMLPPGMRLENGLLTIDLEALLARHGHSDLLAYFDRLRINSEAGRLVVEVDAKVD